MNYSESLSQILWANTVKVNLSLCSRVLLAGAVLMLPTDALPQQFSPQPLIVNIMSDEGLVNSARSNGAETLRVQVLTGSHEPAANALVQFQAPDAGPGGVFPNGHKTLQVTADANGVAAANGFQPNRQAGAFEIRVTALQGSQSGFATIHQTNSGVSSSPSHRRWWILAGVVVAGAAGGTVAALHHGSSSATSISTGGVTVGAPH